MWLYLARAFMQELWLDTARAASTAQTLQCSALQVWAMLWPWGRGATGKAGCSSETPQVAKWQQRCVLGAVNPLSASDSKLCAAFSIAPQSDSPPALPCLLHWENLLLDVVYQETAYSASAARSLFLVAPEA